MIYYIVEHMPPKDQTTVSQPQDEALGTDHLGSVESMDQKHRAITPLQISQALKQTSLL